MENALTTCARVSGGEFVTPSALPSTGNEITGILYSCPQIDGIR
jgi:hypothetical protein